MKMKNIKRNIIAAIYLLILTGLFSLSAFGAAPPPNDNFADAEPISGIQIHIERSNADATRESGEPNHVNNPGGKSVWFKWVAPMSRLMNFSTNRTSTNLNTLLQVYSGTSLNNLATMNGSNDIDDLNLKSNASFLATQGTTYYIAVDGARIDEQTAEGTFKLDISPVFRAQGADYDNDGQTNLAVFRPSAGTFFHLNTWTQQTIYTLWGTSGDIPSVGGDHAGNDFSVFRPANGMWYMRPSQCCANDQIAQWGQENDIPVQESFGGSAPDLAVFRPSNGTWYIYAGANEPRYYRFGSEGDIPVQGHYSPDNFADIAVFRPSDGVWYILKRVSGNEFEDTFTAVKFGQAGDKPVPADFDGDGILDIAVYRPSTGNWYVLKSSDAQVRVFKWGIAEDVPATGDYDGDGIFDYAVWRPSNGIWYIHRSSDNSVQIKQFGQAGDIPVTSNFGR